MNDPVEMLSFCMIAVLVLLVAAVLNYIGDIDDRLDDLGAKRKADRQEKSEPEALR